MAKEKIEVDKKGALEAYSTAGATEKKLLEKLFGKELFSSTSDWIKVWEKFYKENKLKVVLPHEKPTTPDEESDNAYVMLRNIIKIKNGGWVPNWNDSSYKYYPYFNMESGFAFSSSFTVSWDAYAVVGSRLCFKNEKLAISTAKEFISIYEKFMK